MLSFTQISQATLPNPHEKMKDFAVASVHHAIHVAEKPRLVKARREHLWHMLRRKPHLNKASWAKRSFSRAFPRSTTQKGAVGAFPSQSLSHLLRRRIPSHHAVSFGKGRPKPLPLRTTTGNNAISLSPVTIRTGPLCNLRAKIPQPSYAYFLTSPKAPLDGKHPCQLLQSSHSVVAAEKMGVSDWEGASSSRGWESLSAPELSTFDRLRQSPASNMAQSHLLPHS